LFFGDFHLGDTQKDEDIILIKLKIIIIYLSELKKKYDSSIVLKDNELY